jgi:hypothetical protein
VRPGDLLRQLDRHVLPRLARGAARLGHGALRLRLLSGVALLCTAAVLVTAVWAADQQPVGDPTRGDVTRVGVVQGQSIPGYVEASRSELAALLAAPATGPAPRTYALVAFSAYLAPDRLPPVLAGVEVSEVYARLWRPGVQTQIVRIPAQRIPEDVIAGMLEVAERKDREARDYRERSAAVVGDGPREQELRRWYDSGAQVASDEAIAYRSRCSCVYAAVVRGEPVALDRVANRSGVRAVDPAPEVRRLDRTVFTPPLPEQVDVVRPPADASLPPEPGVPSGSPTSPASSDVPTETPGGPGGPSVTTPTCTVAAARPTTDSGGPHPGPAAATTGAEPSGAAPGGRAPGTPTPDGAGPTKAPPDGADPVDAPSTPVGTATATGPAATPGGEP